MSATLHWLSPSISVEINDEPAFHQRGELKPAFQYWWKDVQGNHHTAVSTSKHFARCKNISYFHEAFGIAYDG